MKDDLGRRAFVGMVGAVAVSGCLGTSSRDGTDDPPAANDGAPTTSEGSGGRSNTETPANVGTVEDGSPPDAYEVEGIELGDVKQAEVRPGAAGVVATVYNSTSDAKRVTVQFSLWSTETKVAEATDDVVVPAYSKAPVSYYWDTSADLSGWEGYTDAKISSVSG